MELIINGYCSTGGFLTIGNPFSVAPDPPVPEGIGATHSLTDGWATFGQVVPQGAVPSTSGIQVGSLDTQMDVKTTWSDGSARFVVITCKPTEPTGNYTLGLVPRSSGTFAPTIPSAYVELAGSGTGVVWTATMPSTISSDPWLAGEKVREWRNVVAPVDGSGNAHSFLRVYFDTRVYNDNAARVDVTVENCLDTAAAQDIIYTATINVDGVEVFNKEHVTHYYLCRWRKKYGVGLTESDVVLDWSLAQQAGAVPKYLDTIADASYSTTGEHFEILARGVSSVDYMGTTGGRPDIAPYPDWAARFMVFGDLDQREFTLAGGDLAGSWPIHIREMDGSFVSLEDRPNFWLDPRGGPGDKPAGSFTGAAGALQPDTAHTPSFAYIPYLTTGDRYYADEMIDWGHWGILNTWPVTPATPAEDGRSGGLGIVGTSQVRGRAWNLRNLVDAAAYSSDNDSVKSYFTNIIMNNLNYYEDYCTTLDIPLDIPFAGISADGLGNYYAYSQWQNNYVAWSIDHANRQGFIGATNIRDMIIAFQVRLFNSEPDYPRTYACPYYPTIGTVEQPSKVITHYTTMAQIYETASTTGDPADSGPLFTGPVDFNANYGIDGRISLLMGIQLGLPGAQDALDYLLPFIVNGSLTSKPGWSIDPSDFE